MNFHPLPLPPLKIYIDVFDYHTIEKIFFLYNQRGKEKHLQYVPSIPN